MVVNTGDNRWATSNFIVAPTLAEGASYTTIAAALTAASSGNTIFIKPGTYTENLTLKAGVNLCAYECDAYTPNVIISGKSTATFAGSASLSGIRLQTNSDFALAITGSSATIIRLINCFINASNNTAISFTSSSPSANLIIEKSEIDLATTGIAHFADSSAGNLRFDYCYLRNSGLSTTASTISAGVFYFYNSNCDATITTSSTTAVLILKGSYFNNTNLVCLTHGCTAVGSSARNCEFSSGSASAISVSVSATLDLSNCVIGSTNTNAITGAGTLNISEICFTTGSSSTINTTTVTGTPMTVGMLRSSTHPAFLATKTANQNLATGDSTTVTVGYSTEIYDQNSNYDATNTFTAPLGGRYAFAASMNFSGTLVGHNIMGLNFVASNRTLNTCGYEAFNITPTGATCIVNTACEVDMDAADTVVMSTNVNGGTKVINLVGGFFAGHLIC